MNRVIDNGLGGEISVGSSHGRGLVSVKYFETIVAVSLNSDKMRELSLMLADAADDIDEFRGQFS